MHLNLNHPAPVRNTSINLPELLSARPLEVRHSMTARRIMRLYGVSPAVAEVLAGPAGFNNRKARQ
jgi:hypothetical protein